MFIDGDGSRLNRVDHNLFEGKRELGNCITIEGSEEPELQVSQHDRIDHNHFRNIGPRHEENGLETIRLGWSRMFASSGFTTVEENLFEHCDGDAEVISVKCSDNRLRRNTFIDCQGSLVLRHGNRNTVEECFFLCNNGKRGVGGVRVIGEGHKIINNYFGGLTGTGFYWPLVLMNGDTEPGTYTASYHQVRQALIAHNTFVNCIGNTLDIGKINGTGQLPVKDSVIANNIVVGYTPVGSEDVLVMFRSEPENLVWQGNIMYHASAELGMTAPESAVRWVDPKLVRSADGVWRLAEASPAIDAAEGSYPDVARDLDGEVRDERPDTGADEYLPASNGGRHPLTPADVGVDAPEGDDGKRVGHRSDLREARRLRVRLAQRGQSGLVDAGHPVPDELVVLVHPELARFAQPLALLDRPVLSRIASRPKLRQPRRIGQRPPILGGRRRRQHQGRQNHDRPALTCHE